MANWREDLVVAGFSGAILWVSDRIRDFIAVRRTVVNKRRQNDRDLQIKQLEERTDLEIAKVQDGAAFRDDLITLMRQYYEEAKEARKELAEARKQLYDTEQERIKCEQKYRVLEWEFGQLKHELEALKAKVQQVENNQNGASH